MTELLKVYWDYDYKSFNQPDDHGRDAIGTFILIIRNKDDNINESDVQQIV